MGQVFQCVSVGFGSKGRDFWCFARAENGGRETEPNIKYGGGGGEGRKRLQTNPWILKTSVRQRTELVIGWASRKLLTSVDQRALPSGCQREVKLICLQRVFTFLAERRFCHNLRQYGRNPVVYCRRFGI